MKLLNSLSLIKSFSEKQIKNYLELEDPTNCVGSIKSEGLGIMLLEEIQCNDPYCCYWTTFD